MLEPKCRCLNVDYLDTPKASSMLLDDSHSSQLAIIRAWKPGEIHLRARSSLMKFMFEDSIKLPGRYNIGFESPHSEIHNRTLGTFS